MLLRNNTGKEFARYCMECANTTKNPLLPAGWGLNSAGSNTKISSIFTNQEKRKKENELYFIKNTYCRILQNPVTMIKYTWVLPKRVAVHLLPKWVHFESFQYRGGIHMESKAKGRHYWCSEWFWNLPVLWWQLSASSSR